MSDVEFEIPGPTCKHIDNAIRKIKDAMSELDDIEDDCLEELRKDNELLREAAEGYKKAYEELLSTHETLLYQNSMEKDNG